MTALANAVAATTDMCWQERRVFVCHRCRNNFIGASVWHACPDEHDTVSSTPAKTRHENPDALVCLWCQQGEKSNSAFRAYHEQLLSDIELWYQARAKATLSSAARLTCDQEIERLVDEMRRTAVGSSSTVLRMLRIVESLA